MSAVKSPKHLSGDLSQAYFVARCLELGWDVALPTRQHCRYDALVDRGNGFMRVQIKTGRLLNGALYFDVHSRGIRGNKRYTEEEVDLFGIYSKDLRKCYVIPIEVAQAKKSLRLDKYDKKPSKITLWAKDFEI